MAARTEATTLPVSALAQALQRITAVPVEVPSDLFAPPSAPAVRVVGQGEPKHNPRTGVLTQSVRVAEYFPAGEERELRGVLDRLPGLVDGGEVLAVRSRGTAQRAELPGGLSALAMTVEVDALPALPAIDDVKASEVAWVVARHPQLALRVVGVQSREVSSRLDSDGAFLVEVQIQPHKYQPYSASEAADMAAKSFRELVGTTRPAVGRLRSVEVIARSRPGRVEAGFAIVQRESVILTVRVEVETA